MVQRVVRQNKMKNNFRNVSKSQHQHAENNSYQIATETMSVDDKLKVLEELGKTELIDLFRDWKPRRSNKSKKGAPLDQRITITVTDQERFSLDKELKNLKSIGERISMSQFIRNRALGTVDINGWREIADKALKELDDTEKNKTQLEKTRVDLGVLIDEEDDPDQADLYGVEIDKISRRLSKLVAHNEKRNNRLSGRMSMPESETVKWRAQRLCISSSDYLRMMIFGLVPDSSADAHMSLDAKKRFYISIIDVSINGWGTPPTVYECSQCVNYMDEIRRLRDENDQLRAFV